MIGGNDIVFPAVGDSAALEACARIVGRCWPDVRFEDAITGDKYRRFGDIPFGKVRELLAYLSAEAEAPIFTGVACGTPPTQSSLKPRGNCIATSGMVQKWGLAGNTL